MLAAKPMCIIRNKVSVTKRRDPEHPMTTIGREPIELSRRTRNLSIRTTRSAATCQLITILSGVSRISARGVLKVRPHTKSGGGACHFRSDTFGHTENIYMYLPKVGTCRYFLVETTYVTQAENFTYIGCIA